MRMHRFVLARVILCSVLVLAQQAMNNDSVEKMIKAGLSDDTIAAAISSSPGGYDTSADALIALKRAGASDKVISAILIKSSSAAAAPSALAASPAEPNSQTPAAQEPELMGKLFFLKPNTQTLTQLPREQWKRKVKRGFTTVKALDVVAGEHSSFRISSKDRIVFVFRPFPDQVNAIQGIRLFTFAVTSGERICMVQEQKGRTHQGNLDVISFDAVKYGASSYALTPSGSNLAPGEYWVHVPGAGSFNDPLTTFGVD